MHRCCCQGALTKAEGKAPVQASFVEPAHVETLPYMCLCIRWVAEQL